MHVEDVRAFSKDCLAISAIQSLQQSGMKRSERTQGTIIAGPLAFWTTAFKCDLADAADVVVVFIKADGLLFY